ELLTINGASAGAGMPAGSEVTLIEEAPGVVLLQFQSPAPLGAGEQVFVDLQATVPQDAPYAAKHILDIEDISINAGGVPAIDDDGVHVVAYFGDVTGNGTYSSLDSSRVSRMAVGLDTGFAAFPLADPVLVGDLTMNGGFSSLDTSRISRVVVGLPVDEVPAQPSPLPALIQTGPDPKLSIPRTLAAHPGDAITVPIEIDSIVDLTGTELHATDLVIRFDPAVLTIDGVSAGDIPRSTPEAAWSGPLYHVDNKRGELIIGLYNAHGLGGKFAGSLVTIAATVSATVAVGTTPLNLAASSTVGAAITSLNEGSLTLIPAPTDSADDAIDGAITVHPQPAEDLFDNLDWDGLEELLDEIVGSIGEA
ncbi:MAG: cohesin domain-containing protein, partial [Planctomycetes bacterium]|nr:cohesin domain-containing protein [Planctomycetota bacterium]